MFLEYVHKQIGNLSWQLPQYFSNLSREKSQYMHVQRHNNVDDNYY